MKDMNEKEILRHVDHTLLSQEAVWDEIRQVCDDAVKYDTASVCIPPSYVKQAAEYVGGRVPICTQIGFRTVTRDDCQRNGDKRCDRKRRR